MIAVIFEVTPHTHLRDDYLSIAANLKPMLESIDGFISVERFASLTQEDKILSLSFWRDEESIARWRTLAAHREAQCLGREQIFAEYRLRVATVVRDYGLSERAQVPADAPE